MNKNPIWKARVTCIVLLVVGVGTAIISTYTNRTEQAIQTNGIEAVADVVEAKEKTGRRWSKSHYLTLRYAISNGKWTTNEVQVPSDVFEQATADGRVKIKYDPAIPHEIVYVDFPYSVTGRYVAAALFAAIGAVGCFFSFRAKAVDETTT